MNYKVENLRDGKFPDSKTVSFKGQDVSLSLGKYPTEYTRKVFDELREGSEVQVTEYTNKKGYTNLYLIDPEKKTGNPNVKMAGIQEQIAQLTAKVEDQFKDLNTKMRFIADRIDKALEDDPVKMNPNQSKAVQSKTAPIDDDVPF